MDTAQKTQTETAEIIRHPQESRGSLAVQTTQPPNIGDRPVVAAIARIMAEVGSVKKDARNTFHNYDYASAAAIANALQKLMADNGLVIVQQEREVQYMEAMGTLAIKYDFSVLHTSGDCLPPIQQTGMSAAKNSKGGFDDKAANKCHTAARKYFLLGLFHIPTGDYPDADGHEESPAEKPKKSRAQAYQDQKPADTQATSETPKASKFEVVSGDGEILESDTLSKYMADLSFAVAGAASPAGVWESNQKGFTYYLDAYAKAGKTKQVDALNELAKNITSQMENPDAR